MRRVLTIVAAVALLALGTPVAIVAAHEPGNACNPGKPGSSSERNPHCRRGHRHGGQPSAGPSQSPSGSNPTTTSPSTTSSTTSSTTTTTTTPSGCLAAYSDCDGDRVPRVLDNCPSAANPGQSDANDDGEGDACDFDDDSDRDGTPDFRDTCAADPVHSPDEDRDGLGNRCDSDNDGDGIPDVIDGNLPVL